jgi:hypothetical protein
MQNNPGSLFELDQVRLFPGSVNLQCDNFHTSHSAVNVIQDAIAFPSARTAQHPQAP